MQISISSKLNFVSIAHNRFYRPLEDIKVGGNTFYISYSALQLLFNFCHGCTVYQKLALTCLACFLQNAVTSIAKRKESCKEDRKVK